MELDYIESINAFDDNVVRLYNFNKSQAIKFRDLINDTVIIRKQKLDLSQVEFIESRNCNLILGLFREDEGILSDDNKTFYCLLTLESYKTMLELLEPFCNKETIGYQYLYDVDNPTDLLFSPAGTW
jgi:hypothetical protein|tara:strand:- start:18 stop:398 length:381 start_codon:yes stop_codon:yes gene_type:complete